ncbi:MAG: amidohydrolase family protein [Myxococcota bacterium]|nr:amidohydrolase family protein [Myxococcota bacterium]
MKIDLHTHILPKEWPDLNQRYGYGEWIQLQHHKPCCARMMRGDQFFREIEDDCWSPTRRMKDCDEHQVDVQVLSTVPVMFSYWARPTDTLDLSKLLNDHIAGIVARYPKRFTGLCTLPMQAPELAIRELERCMKNGFDGVEIGTHINDWNLDDEALEPFWAAAEELGAAIFVHPWDMMGQGRMPRHWLPWLVSMPAETSLAICSIAMGGILERYPKLRICFAHGGGSFPATIGRIDHGFDVRPDLCQTRTKRRPSDFLKEFYLDSLVHDEHSLRFIAEKMSPERIALGTDYPFPLGELSPGKLIEAASFSIAEKERMLSGTALEFLGRLRQEFETEASRAHSLGLL